MKIQNIILAHNCRPWQNPWKVPFKELKPLKAKNKFLESGRDLSGAVCLHEMSLLFECLKQNSFNEIVCEKEISNFQKCFETANKKKATNRSSNSRLEINQLMEKYCKK